MLRTLLKFQVHPKLGPVCYCSGLEVLDCLVIPSIRSEALTLLIPRSAPPGSRSQKRMDVRAEGEPCRVKKTWVFCDFHPFLCLPVMFKFNGLPSR